MLHENHHVKKKRKMLYRGVENTHMHVCMCVVHVRLSSVARFVWLLEEGRDGEAQGHTYRSGRCPKDLVLRWYFLAAAHTA